MPLSARKAISMPEYPLRLTHLLTIWLERSAQPGQPAVWRFSLEDIQTRERRGFASLDALMEFLKTQMMHTETKPNGRPPF